MLVLARRKDEVVVIGTPPNVIEVMVTDVRGDQVKLGFKAPVDVPIHRKEVADAIEREGRTR